MEAPVCTLILKLYLEYVYTSQYSCITPMVQGGSAAKKLRNQRLKCSVILLFISQRLLRYRVDDRLNRRPDPKLGFVEPPRTVQVDSIPARSVIYIRQRIAAYLSLDFKAETAFAFIHQDVDDYFTTRLCHLCTIALDRFVLLVSNTVLSPLLRWFQNSVERPLTWFSSTGKIKCCALRLRVPESNPTLFALLGRGRGKHSAASCMKNIVEHTKTLSQIMSRYQ